MINLNRGRCPRLIAYVVSIIGNKVSEDDSQFLHKGIPRQPFERKFHLAEYVEVTGADLSNGLLSISLKRELPDSMKPRSIPIHQDENVIEHNRDQKLIENQPNKGRWGSLSPALKPTFY